jgi:subtilisin
MQNKRMRFFARFSRAFGIVFLYSVLGVNPVPAQVTVHSTGGGQAPPCEVGAAASSSAAFPCGVILFSPRGSVSSSELAGRARAAGASVRFEYNSIMAAAARVPNRGALNALVDRDVVLIPDRRVNAIARPPGKGGGGGSPTQQTTPAGVKRIGADKFEHKGSGIGVAIVDTGLDFNHADFKRADGSAVISEDCVDTHGGSCQDQNGHGTHVGGIVAAQDNLIDVVGVAPDVTLHAVRVLDSSGSGYDSDIIAGLDWIWVQNGENNATIPPRISVANMSLGRGGNATDSPPLLAAVQQLTGTANKSGAVSGGQGVTVVVAAGNDPRLEIHQQVPAAYKEVLAIASTTALEGSNACSRLSSAIPADTASYFTTDGKDVVVSAPGADQENVSRGCMISSVGILSLKLGGGTTRMSGTSMAAPHVAGVAAMMLGNRTTDPNDIRAKIRCGANGIGTAPLDSPTSSYTPDGVREGILSAPGAMISGTSC